ncbi:uncharacterized protein LOC110697653 isoform X1 [Chenopodium quinoa]|uniref:uncharacterized protein LOC110697653 isoform X1 n=1 Tax=Chenopodium quinoa TaxID=63459 RepID=UPI000B77716F|nr:uncharacterized protein LOC110697653 isoform X1 [Chenopodium quinoa]XP_021730725.1 uncharacterized protein LOC110697653 isoform X1 [Chenopodium quinoa]XP_021730726.1 uncharacterized protein LOC110697653 isoform X1 [Chenopodium quinoa]XP_021730727.1 uncharacterized protein LOC110697653 isoform X1 [Chenopodium quinoa]XP_021730728.1 uncharacterized protein LOC110697653 isoform X1 [Chenopodium quinoa]XP_021730729.1 uncharacterized protein LOC110697653 isoform X1 [Chenopodium quinoa]XP_02173073
MKKIYKKELEPEPIPLTVPGEPVTEDDWTMKTMRKWTRKIKLKMGISKMKKVTEDEVDLLYDLFNKLSNSVVKDGFIQKEELQLALFKNSMKRSLFLDRDELRQLCLYAVLFLPLKSMVYRDNEKKVAFRFLTHPPSHTQKKRSIKNTLLHNPVIASNFLYFMYLYLFIYFYLEVLDYPPIERSSGTPRKAVHEGYQEQVFCKNQLSSLNSPLNVLYQLQTLTIIIFNRRTTRKFSTLNSLTNMYTILLYILYLIHFTLL